jgi:putative transposase
LQTKPILEQIGSKDKHRAYREKVQRYADEEKKLWEDFRHGMILGTKEVKQDGKDAHYCRKC